MVGSDICVHKSNVYEFVHVLGIVNVNVNVNVNAHAHVHVDVHARVRVRVRVCILTCSPVST